MALDAFPGRISEPESVASLIRFVGGSAAVTKVLGSGITVSYVSTGIVSLVWADNPGVFAGLLGSPAFQATTQANVKSFVGVVGAWSSTTRTLQLRLYEGGTLADLEALEWCSLAVVFKRTSV